MLEISCQLKARLKRYVASVSKDICPKILVSLYQICMKMLFLQ